MRPPGGSGAGVDAEGLWGFRRFSSLAEVTFVCVLREMGHQSLREVNSQSLNGWTEIFGRAENGGGGWREGGREEGWGGSRMGDRAGEGGEEGEERT